MNDESTPKGAPEVSAATLQIVHAGPDNTATTGEVAAFFDGLTRGQAEGYARGRADHEAESWPEACRIVNAATRSLGVADARAKPYTTPGWAK